MNIVRHGLSVGIDRVGHHFFLNFRVSGKLTHEDYGVMVPLLESAIEGVRHPSINALVDVTELEGWEMRAAWDDLKLGIKHGGEFNRIAVVGKRKWMKLATTVGAWFMSGRAEFFEDRQNAINWLCENERDHVAV